MVRSNELWIQHLSGGEAEQQAALADLRAALLRGLRGALPDADVPDALLEDAAQDTLVRVLDRLSQFEGRSRFVTWATSIAIRLALTELRRKRWRDVSLDDLTAETAASGDAIETEQERHQIIERMNEIIHKDLTPRQRAVLVAELKGMPQAEIARRLGSNRNAIYKLTHDARKRLRRGLEHSGYSADDVRAVFTS